MAFFFQYRDLSKRVQQQLDAHKDKEKGVSGSPRLSGETTRDAFNEARLDKGGSGDDYPYASLPGITLSTADDGSKYYLVSWESDDDATNPHNWSLHRRIGAIFLLIAVAFVCTAASSIDSAVAVQAAKEFRVSEVVEALGGTASFLIGFGWGSLLCSPLSEMLGRYPVYLATLVIFGCWLVGAALSPNIGAQIVFRTLAGVFASCPLTVAGGSVADMFNARERTWAFPVFAVIGFGGPTLGPVIGSYMGISPAIDWRWTEWIMLITIGLVLALLVLFMRETLGPQILMYKAGLLRKQTGDARFKTQAEAAGGGLGQTLKTNFTRPFLMALEPIVMSFTLYLAIVYIVLFTFLVGYPYIFEMTYGLNEGLSNLCFLGLLVGISSAMVLLPLVWSITTKQLDRDGDEGKGENLRQETRLIFSMIGAPLVPIGLFWMAWTDYVSSSSFSFHIPPH